MNGFTGDLRFALRMFVRARAFYGLVVVILALGIASSVSVFSLIDGVLLRPLPYRDPQRLVTITTFAPKPPFESNGSVSYLDYQQITSKARSFSEVATTFRVGWSRITLTGGSEPVTMQGAFVSPNLLHMFGRSPLLGRTFTEDENRHAERVAVISQALWAESFASSPQALGKTISISGQNWQIIGVMPSDFQVPFLDTQVWLPVLSHPGWYDKEEANPLAAPRWDLFARLRPGVSMAAAQAETGSIWKALRATSPDPDFNDVKIVPLREHFAGSVRTPLTILLAAVGLLLLIALANVANLLLARSSQRRRELAIRVAIGAGKGRIIRQLATEALLVSCLGGLLGVTAAQALVPLLKAVAPSNTPFLTGVAMDGRCLLFAALLSVTVGLLLGLAPAWQPGSEESNESLKSVAFTAGQSRQKRVYRGVLVTAEFAIAMVLLTGAALLIRSFAAVLAVNPGFRVDRILTLQIGLTDAIPPAQMTRFYHDALARIEALPGVQAAGGVGNLFFLDESRVHALRLVEGHAPEPKTNWTPLVWTQVSGHYFQTMGIPLLRGRFFSETDTRTSSPVVIINQTLARRYWPHEDALGKRVKGFDPRGLHDDWLTVVGIVADTHSGGLEKKPFSQIYEVQAQHAEQLGNLVVRTAANPYDIAASIRTLLHGLDRNIVIPSINTAEQLLVQQEHQRRFQTWLIAVFSGLALALAALGVFAVMHYLVMARRNELGLRMALGAKPADVTKLVLAGGTRLAAGGVLIGALAGAWFARSLSAFLYEVKPGDFISFASAAAVLLIVALLASYLPALSASRIDPMVALRQE